MKTDVDVGDELSFLKRPNISSDGALFLFYVRDTINNMYDHQLRHDNLLHFRNQVVGIDGSSGSSASAENAAVGHSIMIAPSNNVTHHLLDDYQQPYDESAFDQSMYGNINKSSASGDELSENFSSPYLMLWPQRSAWISVFTLMLIVATVGNTLVAWIVLGQLLFHLISFPIKDF